MSSYVIPLFPAAAASPLPTRDAVAAELSRLRDRVDAGLPGKADKVPSASAGNLASLDASGNLADSGATPASIKAAAVAEVVANAPGTMDTLEEIADILGSTQQTGTVLKRILDLESGKADSSSLAAVATSGSYADLSGKPTIPAAVTVDATLATRGAAADAEATGDALDGKRGVTDLGVRGAPEGDGDWFTFDGSRLGWSDGTWSAGGTQIVDAGDGGYILSTDGLSQTDVLFEIGADFTALVEGHRIVGYVGTLAKESQLPDVAGKADKVSGATAGNLASLTAQGNLADGGVKPSDFATPSDLPYRLVEPGKWEFSGLPSGVTVSSIYFDDSVDDWNMVLSDDAVATVAGDGSELSLVFSGFSEGDYTIAATRPSLPGHLLDRAVNAVSVSGATTLTLTLPAAVPGKARDLVVRTAVTGTPAISISSTDSSGQSVTMLDTPSFFDGAIFGITEVAAGTFSVTDPNPPRQVQSNWDETDQDSPAFIQNKPTIPTVPAAYTSAPPMDSANGSAGDSAQWSPGNHSHPTDTSRAPLASPALTGTPTAPTASAHTNTTQIATTAFVVGESRYDLVTAQQTGGWKFGGSGVQSGVTYTLGDASEVGTDQYVRLLLADGQGVDTSNAEESADSPSWTFPSTNITATRAWALQDRARNYVSLTSDGTLQLPVAVPGKMRDLVVRLVLTATSNVVPSPSFDDSVDYEAEGGVFPDFSEEGTYIVRLTETDQTVVSGAVTSAIFFIQSSLVELVSAGGAS